MRSTLAAAAGAVNWRDLGEADARRLQRGRVFRGAACRSRDSLAALRRLYGLQLIIDLRSDAEAAGDAPGTFADFRTAYVHDTAYSGAPAAAAAAAAAATAAAPVRLRVPLLRRGAFIRALLMRSSWCACLRIAFHVFCRRYELVTALVMAQLNRGGVALLYECILESARQEVCAALRAVAAAPGPVAVMCAAGKDRTGLVAALALELCGVPDDAIVADYVRSDGAAVALGDVCPPDARARAALDPEILNRAPAAAMRATLAWLRRRHGGAAGYLARGGGGMGPREQAQLRDLLCAAEPRWLRCETESGR